MGCRYLASHTEERARACQLDEARCRGVEAEQLLADVLLVGQFGDVDDLVSPAIVASCGQGALDNDVVFCQLAKVVVLEKPDTLRRGELLVPTDVLARVHIALALPGATLRRDQVVRPKWSCKQRLGSNG